VSAEAVRGEVAAWVETSARPGARWVSRIARGLNSVYGDPCAASARDLVQQHPVWTDPGVDLDGLPVLLIGGLASMPDSLELLAAWLRRVGARVEVPPIGYGVDCGERTARRTAVDVARVVEAAGRPCVLLAHSRGGHFARAVAVRRPDLVGGLITLGTPVNRLLGIRPLLRAELAVIATLGTLGVPGLLATSCLWGTCCRSLRADLTAPLPERLPHLVVYSQQDEVVDWRSCLEPAARHRAVTATHSGMLRSAEVLQILAAELAALSRPQAPGLLAAA
jgi:triacylglycerol lipase